MAAEMKVVLSAEDKGASSTIDKVEGKLEHLGNGGAGAISRLTGKVDELARIGVPGMNALSGAFGTAEAAQGSFLGKMGLVIGGASALGAALAAIGGKAVAAASEGEQAMVRLSSALKATGGYSDAAVADIEEFAAALLRTKGTGDELTMSLIGQGATMGLTIEQSKRFVSAAADMEDIVGSVAGGFDALARASTGDERALMTLGKQFGIAKAEGLSFAEMLDRIEEKTSGNAAAKIETFAGAWKLFSEDVGNFLEKAGTPLMKWLAQQPDQIRAAGSAWSRFFDDFKAAGGDPIFQGIWKMLNAPGALLAKTPGYLDQQPRRTYDVITTAPRVPRGIDDGGLSGNYSNFIERQKKLDQDRAKAAQDAASKRVQIEKDALKAIEDATREFEAQQKAAHFEDIQNQIDNQNTLNDAMLAGSRRRAAEQAAAEQVSIRAITDEIKKWSDEYGKLEREHERALKAIERTEDEHTRKLAAIRDAERNAADALLAVQSRGASEGEKKVLDRMKLEDLQARALATKDLAEKLNLLNDAARLASTIDFSLDSGERRAAMRSEIPGVSERAGDMDLTKAKDAAEEAQNVIRDIQAELTRTLVDVSEQDAALLASQRATADDIESKMTAAAAKIGEATAAARKLSEELASDKRLDIQTDAARNQLEELIKKTEELFKMFGEGAVFEIRAFMTASPRRPFSEGVEGMKNKLLSLPRAAAFDVRAAGMPRVSAGAAPGTVRSGGPQSVVINVTTAGRTAKDIDRELAALWQRKSSALRKAVAA